MEGRKTKVSTNFFIGQIGRRLKQQQQQTTLLSTWSNTQILRGGGSCYCCVCVLSKVKFVFLFLRSLAKAVKSVNPFFHFPISWAFAAPDNTHMYTHVHTSRALTGKDEELREEGVKKKKKKLSPRKPTSQVHVGICIINKPYNTLV